MSATTEALATKRAAGTAAPRVVLVPTARPTFAVDVARRLADEARALLVELGADVSGPRSTWS